MTVALKRIAFIFLLLFAIIPAFAQVPDTIPVRPGFKEMAIGTGSYHRIGNNFERFSDNPAKWEKITQPNYKLSSDSIHWIYAILKNEDSIDRNLKLYLNNVQAGIVKLYVVTDGKIDSSLITGSLVAVQDRATTDRLLSFPVQITSGKITEIYLKNWRRQTGITLTLMLVDPSYNENSRSGDYILILTLGLLLLIVPIAFLLYLYFPSKENLCFLFYMIPSFFYVLAASGFGSLYLWSGFPWFEENAAIFFGNIGAAAFFEFSRRILQLKQTNRVINKLLIIFSICQVVSGILGFGIYFDLISVGVFNLSMAILYLFFLSLLLTIFVLSAYKAIIKKQHEFWWFVSIFIFYIIFTFVSIALEAGLLTYSLKMKFLLLPFGVLPQMTLILIFLIRRAVKILKEKELKIADTRLQGQQDLLNERLRLSRDLHDEVGATLSGIAMYSHLTKEQMRNDQAGEVEKSLNIIQQGAGEMVTKLSDIVWFVNPGQDSLQKLFQRLEEYAADMASVKKMQVKVSMPADAENISLPVESRRNIYLLCKEAINNSVKYSDADLLKLTVKRTETELEFLVSDNGKGFNTSKQSNGNGLENIRKRAEGMNAFLQIDSRPGGGTSISVVIKIT
ncbi:MAG: 7TM diverse intracellular signaling domain-containing protein [Ferruginibacter sp.]